MNDWKVILDSGERVDHHIFDYILRRRMEIPDTPDPTHMNLAQILDTFIHVVTEDLLAHGRKGYFIID